ncbi:MAG: N-acetyltransferase [bacterium]|nr:N-acetyltransferase [bacterium]
MEVNIRLAADGDATAIHRVHTAAFPTSAEAELVDNLRKQNTHIISLVAEVDDVIVGHILFTPATIENKTGPSVTGLGLAPLAVVPDYQNLGIGSELTRLGMAVATNGKYDFVIVLGHPDYYPRFGFDPAAQYGIGCEYPDVGDAFMISFLGGEIPELEGIARYHPAFAE